MVLINGVETDLLDVSDRGFQYGDGVFTTLPVEAGVPLFLQDHLRRLERDSARIGLPGPDLAVIRQEAAALAASNPRSVLKIIWTTGCGGRGYRRPVSPQGSRVLACHPMPNYPEDWSNIGVSVRFCRMRLGINPVLAGVKHLNRLEQVMARAEWTGDDIQEGLVRDADGYIVEGIMSNLFVVDRAGRLHTPLIDRCGVAGVMRAKLIQLARDLGLAVEESRMTSDQLQQAAELFLTNSIIRLWPIRQLDGRAYAAGNVTRLLASKLDELIAEDRR